MSLTSLAIKVADLSIAGLFPLLAVLLLRLCWRRLPRRLMMLAWLIVALRLMVPISVQSPAGTVPAEATHVTQTLYQNVLADTQPQTAVPAPQAPEQEASPSGFALSAALLSRLWLAGALGMLGYGALSLLRLYRRTACATPLEPGVFEWEGCTSPFILGLLRPRILLPYGMEPRQRELVLLHERSHIRCLDHLKKPLAFFILSVHWFNPLVWIAFGAFCRDLEGACDERVIRGMDTDRRKAYSQTLLQFSAERSPLRCPVAFGETNIKDRILRVLNYKKPGRLLLVIGGLLLVVLAVCFLTNSPENRTSIGIIGGADGPTQIFISSSVKGDALDYKTYAEIAAIRDSFTVTVYGGRNGLIPGPDLAGYLENTEWTPREQAPGQAPVLSVDLGNAFLHLYPEDTETAAIQSGEDSRYYTIPGKDYARLQALVYAPPSSAGQALVPLDTVLELAGTGYDRVSWGALEGYDYTVTSLSPYTEQYTCQGGALMLELQGENQASQQRGALRAVSLFYVPDQVSGLVKLDLPSTPREQVQEYIDQYPKAFSWYPDWEQEPFTRQLPPVDFGAFSGGRLFYYQTPPFGYLTYTGVTAEELRSYVAALQESGFELLAFEEESTILTPDPQPSLNAQLLKGDLAVSLSCTGGLLTLSMIQQSE